MTPPICPICGCEMEMSLDKRDIRTLHYQIHASRRYVCRRHEPERHSVEATTTGRVIWYFDIGWFQYINYDELTDMGVLNGLVSI